MSKKLQKAVELKDSKPKKKSNIKQSIIGVMLLIVVASIAYSTTVIAMGTKGIVPLVMVVPQAVFAVIVLVKQFIK